MTVVLLIAVVAVPLGMVAVVFVLALARVAAKPTPPACGPVGEATMPEAVTFTIPGRLPGLNEYTAANRTHPKAGARAKKEAEWQVAWGVKIARLEPIEGPVFLTFAWHEPDRRRDVDNVAFAKKFILDALVRLGILAGDGRKHVVGFSDEFHLDRRRPRVVVTIERTREHDPSHPRGGGSVLQRARPPRPVEPADAARDRRPGGHLRRHRPALARGPRGPGAALLPAAPDPEGRSMSDLQLSLENTTLLEAIVWRDDHRVAWDQIVVWAHEDTRSARLLLACRPTSRRSARRPLATRLGLQRAGDEPYKINHNLRSGLTRLMLLEYPYLPFRPRRSKCDPSKPAT